jgi:hypothetical protein
MATEPTITVIEDTIAVYDNNPGMASSVAVIGAFDSEVTDLTVCTTAASAHSIFGTTGTAGDFKGTDAIDFLFTGASDLLVANITTWSDDETPVAQTTLTNDKLNAALAKLHHEEFDILFIAEELADASQTIVTTWLANEFKDKFPHGQVAQLSKGTTSAYATSIATFAKNVYYINTQVLSINGTALDLNRSTAYMAGLIASMDVNKSLTAKTIRNVTAISPEYTFQSGDIGAKLMELNVPIIKPRNRRLNNYICVNSLLPDGLDLYINRTRDYVIKRIAVETYLGEQSNENTIEGITTVVENIIETCVNELHLLEGIEYHVTKTSTTTVDIVIDKLIFAGVITDINTHYSIEVQ